MALIEQGEATVVPGRTETQDKRIIRQISQFIILKHERSPSHADSQRYWR